MKSVDDQNNTGKKRKPSLARTVDTRFYCLLTALLKAFLMIGTLSTTLPSGKLR
jgi:hypothetical protein